MSSVSSKIEVSIILWIHILYILYQLDRDTAISKIRLSKSELKVMSGIKGHGHIQTLLIFPIVGHLLIKPDVPYFGRLIAKAWLSDLKDLGQGQKL